MFFYNEQSEEVSTETQPIAIVTDGLQLHLDAGNTNSYSGTGTAWYDLSGNGNDATLVNGPAYSVGNGGFISFDGVDDYAELSPNLQIAGSEITFSVWNYGIEAKISSIIWLESSNGGKILNVHLPFVNNNVYFDIGDGTGAVVGIEKNVTGNEYQGWHHWVFTKNSTTGTMSIYLDGVLWHSGTGLTLNIANPTSATIALYQHAGTDYPHKGYISNLQIYNKALTDAEVLQNFNVTKDRFGL